jgi:hypothetical protein
MCGEQIVAAAKKCKHCGEFLDGTGKQVAPEKKLTDYGLFLIMVPCLGALLNLFWIGNMRLIDGPMAMLQLIAVLVVVGTAIIAATEASSLGFGKDPNASKLERTSPVLWFFGFLILWVWEYPRYLRVRSHFGVKNLFIPGLCVMLFFVGSSLFMALAVFEKQNEFQDNLRTLFPGS